ncbi:hypothetical protein BU24DRAFT_190572 [Aaosphaeria arxii CBS 175.79]|uniref:Uncharacterized protein n=1 Tax=Aaosphaeria arxii CBS 175.79 TaxID=1450172 RepID=A0A6A5XTH9_9PLEO|nr:uncharacterized protein BU24DRAFT_190572 [Aaosphaeria arxii CBS 175.79]KAF2016031.1 hypothetical protein BU24DRAFT_190572 [Aaosphaeria arxii CBS 175.79]
MEHMLVLFSAHGLCFPCQDGAKGTKRTKGKVQDPTGGRGGEERKERLCIKLRKRAKERKFVLNTSSRSYREW